MTLDSSSLMLDSSSSCTSVSSRTSYYWSRFSSKLLCKEYENAIKLSVLALSCAIISKPSFFSFFGMTSTEDVMIRS